MPALRLLVLAGEIDSLIAEIRLRTPLSALAERTGLSLSWRSFHEATRADLRQADVLIVQRAFSQRVARLQRQMHRQGGAVIYEIDDLLTELPAHVSNHRPMLARQASLWKCMRLADLLTVSTERLGQALALPHWHVVPNYAVPLGDASLPPTDGHQAVTLVLASMEALAGGPLPEALRTLPQGAARVVAVGPAAASLAAAGVSLESHALMPREAFIRWVRALPNPVAVIPLEDSRFAACKSAIKWFEYAEAGVPVVCSDVSPYREVVEDGRTGWLVANQTQAWRHALQAAIANTEQRQQVALAARKVVRARHTLDQTVQAWEHAIAQAQRLRQCEPHAAAGTLTDLRDELAFAAEAVALPLRSLNRARLAQRHRR
jgi:hypothetical protein